MSEEQWEIIEIGSRYVLNEETGTLIFKRPTAGRLLRKKGMKEVKDWEPVAIHT